MEFIIAIVVACVIAIPYRKFKMRYLLLLHSSDVSGNEFYGSDEMIEAFNQQLKTQKSEEQ